MMSFLLPYHSPVSNLEGLKKTHEDLWHNNQNKIPATNNRKQFIKDEISILFYFINITESKIEHLTVTLLSTNTVFILISFSLCHVSLNVVQFLK